MTSALWSIDAIVDLHPDAPLPAELARHAATSAAGRDSVALWVALARRADLPADLRAQAAADPRTAVRVAFWTRPDVDDEEAAALLDGETRPRVRETARTVFRGNLPWRAGPIIATPVPDPPAVIDEILAVRPVHARPDGLWEVLAAHPDLTLPVLRRIVAGPDLRHTIDLTPLHHAPFRDKTWTPEVVAAHPQWAAHILAYACADPDAERLILAAQPILAVAAGHYTTAGWWSAALSKLVLTQAALTPAVLRILETAIVADTSIITAVVRTRLVTELPTILADACGTRPGSRWPAPGTVARTALLVELTRTLTSPTVLALPADVLGELLDAHPRATIRGAAQTLDSSRALARVAPGILDRWDAGDPRWLELTAGLAEHAGDPDVDDVFRAVAAHPRFDPIDAAGVPGFVPWLPTRSSELASWPASVVLSALHAGTEPLQLPAAAATAVADLGALDAGATATFVALAADWPGRWGELLRAATLTSEAAS